MMEWESFLVSFRTAMNKFLICSMLSYSLFSGIGLALWPFKEICSSSCGHLQNIHPPFRLKGDPGYCGDRNHELICDDGNNTILNLESGKYHVTNLSYSPNVLRIIDVVLTRGECRLPTGSISPRALKRGKRFQLTSSSWASFVNCSRVVHDVSYRLIPCLSQNDTFVHVVSGYDVKELKPSCSFMAMVPIQGFINESLNEDVFQVMRKGFALSWISNPRTFGYCFTAYFRLAKYLIVDSGGIYQAIPYTIFLEIGFLDCVYKSKDASGLPIAIAFVMILNLILFVLLGRLIFSKVCLAAFLVYQYRKMLLPINAIEKFLRDQPPLTPTRYEYREIANITCHFKEKIGQGGFGSVFKGNIPGGLLVAIKMLGNSTYNGEDFINEVATIGRIHHKNVVRLLGYCSEGSRRALVYEYMPNGSLDKYIFSTSNGANRSSFTWDKLNDIALGVARGIDYLHRGCDMRILHFDIKPQNILLDHDFCPKVSDFGLAKMYPKEHSIVSLSIARGTIGYIAPELVSRSFGCVSHKSDVYSYGMLLLEIAGWRRNMNLWADDSSQTYYPSWIYDRLNKREEFVVNDITDNGTEIGDAERKLCKVGLWCIQMRPSNRPPMSEVIEMLEADSDTLPMPPKPFYSSPQPAASLERFSSETSVSVLSIISEDSEQACM